MPLRFLVPVSPQSNSISFFVVCQQFDIQQPELTVRETVEFCARLRLDAKDPGIGNKAGKIRFVKHVLKTMELTDIENLQVGSYEEGGLSFEQRKRLAIACELAGETFQCRVSDAYNRSCTEKFFSSA